MKTGTKLALLLTMGAMIATVACTKRPTRTPLGATYRILDKNEVWKVPAKTQAQIIGLKPGDVLIAINDEPLKTIAELREWEARLKEQKGQLALTVLRDEQEITLTAKPEPLNFIPIATRYSASLAKALEDILRHFGQTGYYDWLAALTGEAITFSLKENNCSSWGMGGDNTTANLPEVARWTGLDIKNLWRTNPDDSPAVTRSAVLAAIDNALDHKKTLLVYGGWSGNLFLWGIATDYHPQDSTVFGYSLNSGEKQPLTPELVQEIYEVRCRELVVPEPAELLAAVLDQALEMGLMSTNGDWHSGLEAYDILIKQLDQFPACAEGPEVATEHFYRLVWTLISHKESVNRFLEDIRTALPEKAGLLDEVIARNRAVIGRLEGIAATHLPLNSLENQRKLARVITEIQEVENDLLGIYEEIIGEL